MKEAPPVIRMGRLAYATLSRILISVNASASSFFEHYGDVKLGTALNTVSLRNYRVLVRICGVHLSIEISTRRGKAYI
jgi:hypothetical protein